MAYIWEKVYTVTNSKSRSGICNIGQQKLLAYSIPTSGLSTVIHQSSDNGKTWSQLATIPHVDTISLHGKMFSPSQDLAIVSHPGVINTLAATIHRSTDGGVNWSTVYSGDSTDNQQEFYSFCLANSGRLLIGYYHVTAGGVTTTTLIRSDTSGASWGNEVMVGAVGNPREVTGLSQVNGNIILAGLGQNASQPHKVIFRSTDNGSSWVAANDVSSPDSDPHRILDIVTLSPDVVLAFGGSSGRTDGIFPPWSWRSIPPNIGTDWTLVNPSNIIPGFSSGYACMAALKLNTLGCIVAISGPGSLNNAPFFTTSDAGLTYTRDTFQSGHTPVSALLVDQMVLSDPGDILAAVRTGTTFTIWRASSSGGYYHFF